MLLPWIILAPAAGVLLIALVTHRNPQRSAQISCSAVGISFVLALISVIQLLQQQPHSRLFDIEYFTWIQAGTFHAPFGLYLDPLSSVMILVVTGVGLLIHIYSIGYMHGDPLFSRYFAFLNLFIFSMLILVLANNYVLMFVGWELVGLSSYLLIGFWFERKSAADAGKKAFIVNRIGDFGFLIGIFTIFILFHSTSFSDVFHRTSEVPRQMITIACLWLFCGAIGKSAQFPLHVWLPDAMEGPTPVSALIHAATMVTAGVYMVARSFPLYSLSDSAMLLVASTGTFTAIFAASMALVQYDIKRVLAYSTISQLGYMFMALGVGAFTAGIFHLMTHAFFKALLFLCAGSVMHALGGETDFRKMGGLKGPLAKTYWRFLIGGLAISGIFPLSGFFSKDAILLGAYFSEPWGKTIWAIGLITALLTAYYTFRVIFRTFHTPPENPHITEHAHDSPPIMMIPLTILAVLSIAGGWVGIPGYDLFARFLEPVLPEMRHPVNLTTELTLMFVALGAGLLGIFIAYRVHLQRPELAQEALDKPFFARIHTLLARKFYVDEIYHALIVRPVYLFSERVLYRTVDVNIIDGIVNDTAALLRGTGNVFRRFQTGDARTYAAAILIGTLALIVYFLWTVKG
jgi:NADH-quinone oxidoreductase subunit L